MQIPTLQEAIKKRVLVLDGAMGTMIQGYGLTEDDFRGAKSGDELACSASLIHIDGARAAQGRDELALDPNVLMKGNNDLLCLTRPDVIGDIHRRYLAAGADIITANTFSAQRVSMADYHCEHLVADINRAAVRIARQLADEYTRRTPDRPRFVVATIGPTNKSASMSPDVNDPAARDISFDELAEAYAEQIEVLLQEGIDGLLIETIFDTLNAKAAIYVAQSAMERLNISVPLMLSMTVADKSGRTLTGQKIDAFLASVSHADIFSVGLNCSFGPKEIKPFLKELAEKAPYYISVHPNAGLPNALGQYDITPSEMKEFMAEFVDEGLVNIIGGCCGTTDRHIAEYQSIIAEHGIHRREPNPKGSALRLSGLELLELTPEVNFINVGERCNVAGSRKFLRLISNHQYEEALSIARKQVDDGALVLDINMDDGLLDTVAEMTTFLNLLSSDPDIARVPLMIDSSNFEVIEHSLKCLQGKSIVNSISLKEGEDIFLDRARRIKRLGAAVIVMAFDEQGQACTYERKIEVCERAYRLLVEKAGFAPEDIIFDPNILSIATGMSEHDSYALDFIRATKWIRDNLPGAHVSGGVSNLSFAFRGHNYLREAMHAVFLYHAVKAGMDMGIVNPATSVLYADIPDELRNLLEDVVLYRSPDAAERLIEWAQQNAPTDAGVNKDEQNGETKALPLDERLQKALIKGDSSNLEADLAQAVAEYANPVDIIEGPLMEAMGIVGKYFADGRMFLPQVVKTARTMQRAVGILQPYIEKNKEKSTIADLPHKTVANSAGKVLLATVKGDVHDIGKNIVSVVMGCNGFEIVDLGVMVPADAIVEAVIRHKPDIIGLSGLITPSLHEMCAVVEALSAAGIDIPVMIGGATTSALHTALKIAPRYKGIVVWVKDAAQNTLVANELLNPNTHEDFVSRHLAEQKALREAHNLKQTEEKPLATLEQARANKPNLY